MKKKIKMIDLFAGCGGLSDGFEASGYYETVACVEWEKAPCVTLINRLREKWGYEDADKRVLRFDIQRTGELIAGWTDDSEYGSSFGLDYLVSECNENIDIIIGGPPCQAYSVAGRIRDENRMLYDYRNYLFESYLRVVEHFKPKLIVFENVPGMLSAKPGGVSIVDRITDGFNNLNYELIDSLRDRALFDLTEFGVPQRRSRMILVALNRNYFKKDCQTILSDFYSEFVTNYSSNIKYTVDDAISDLPSFYPLETNVKHSGKLFSHSPFSSAVPNHFPRYHSARDISIFRELTLDIEKGLNRFSSITDLKNLYTKVTGKTSSIHKYYVLRWDKPSNTIPAHLYKDGLRHIHPDSKQARSLSVREAARLQTFDDDFIFQGSMGDQYKMIGNAVPPLSAKILAKALHDFF